MSKFALRFAIGLSIALAGSAAHAQAQAPASTPVNPAAQMSPLEYGAIISNANAKKVAAAALAEAAKMGVPMIVAITDTSGNVVYQERQDAAILGDTLSRPRRRDLPFSTSAPRRRSRMPSHQVAWASVFSASKARFRSKASYRSL